MKRATTTKVEFAKLDKFQSTPSVKRATAEFIMYKPPAVISIHALREEGDTGKRKVADITKIFQSTPSVKRATAH